MADGYRVRAMTRAEVDTAVDWAGVEGWNPGARDAACFAPVDPHGFIGGFLDGEMIASISVVNYDETFAFLGFYIVAPAHRGRGYGYRLWQAGVAHAGGRLIGLDGVPAEQENYKRSGFGLAYRNIRHGGVPTAPPDATSGLAVGPVAAADDAIAALDARVFPVPRRTFLDAWLSAEGHVARAVYRGGDLAGFAVARPCRAGWKIGPLNAVDRAAAETLLAALLAEIGPGAEIFLDTPEPNPEAVALAESIGLAPVFETARMYTGTAPGLDIAKIFGVTTFELG
jgi:GNAT superfamily N-acetyltransferase